MVYQVDVFPALSCCHQNIPKDDRHELIKCKEYLKEAEARRGELDLRIDANRAALSVLRKKGEKNVDRCAMHRSRNVPGACSP